MGDVSISCSSAYMKYHVDCISHSYNATEVVPVVKNLISGQCRDHLLQLFFSCVPKLNLSRYQNVCFSDLSSFIQCLPGIFAHQAKNPPLCRFISWITFLSNEAIAWVDDTYFKIGTIALTQLARGAETELCLPKCASDSDTFRLVGDREWEIEKDRYIAGALNVGFRKIRDKLPFIGIITDNKAVRAIDLIYFHVMPALAQQGLRNRDFIEVYKKCSPYTYDINEFIYNYLGPIAHLRISRVIMDYILKPLGSLAVDLTSKALSYALESIVSGIYALENFLKEQTIHGVAAVWNSLFAENLLFNVIAKVLSSLGIVSINVLSGIWQAFIFIKDQYRRVVYPNAFPTDQQNNSSTSLNSTQTTDHRINPITGKPNKETLEKFPEASSVIQSIKRKFSLSSDEGSEYQLRKVDLQVTTEESKKANQEAESTFEDIVISFFDTSGNGESSSL